jgi:hypothetical protein
LTAALGGIQVTVGFLDQTAREGLPIVIHVPASVTEAAGPGHPDHINS